MTASAKISAQVPPVQARPGLSVTLPNAIRLTASGLADSLDPANARIVWGVAASPPTTYGDLSSAGFNKLVHGTRGSFALGPSSTIDLTYDDTSFSPESGTIAGDSIYFGVVDGAPISGSVLLVVTRPVVAIS